MSEDTLKFYKEIIYADKVFDVDFKNISMTLYEEIERLNNIIKTKDEGIKAFIEDLCDTSLELEKKKSILKEVREYIEYYLTKGKTKNHKQFETSILEILDKGE